ncbi:unnamed protein product [Heterobilharzia americana]|nr:unnamed protein product [Heterobilharzia americana]
MRLSTFLTRGLRRFVNRRAATGCFVAGGSLLASYVFYSTYEFPTQRPLFTALCATKWAPQGSVRHAALITVIFSRLSAKQRPMRYT